MIQRNELRTGNWLYGEYTPNFTSIKETFYCQIDEILQDGVRVIFDGHPQPCNFTYGIPITPSILEMCGFEENMLLLSHVIDAGNGIWCDWIDGCCVLIDEADQLLSPIKIKYLHQLQNLYFALTGEELKVNIYDTSK